MTSRDLAHLLRGFGYLVAAVAVERLDAGDYVMLETCKALGEDELRPVAWGIKAEQSEVNPPAGYV